MKKFFVALAAVILFSLNQSSAQTSKSSGSANKTSSSASKSSSSASSSSTSASKSSGSVTKSSGSFSLKLSDEMKEPSNSTIEEYLGQDDDAMYVLRKKISGKGLAMFTMGMSEKEGYILESYNNSLGLITQTEIQPEVNGDKAGLDEVAFLDGHLYAYFIYVNKKSDETDLFYQPVNNKTLMLSGTPEKIAAIDYESKGKQGEFKYNISKDKKTIAITGIRHAEKEENEQFHVYVFDANMERMWDKDVTLKYDSKLFVNEGVLLDNKGNIYMRARIYNEVVKEKKKGEPNYYYKILSYRNNGSDYKEYSVNLKDKFITDLGCKVTDDDKLAIAGFYSDKGTTSIKGVCFMLVDAESQEIIKQGSKDFDASFLELFRRKDINKKKDDPEIYEYDLDNIVVRSDGGALLLAEQYYVYVVTTTSRQGTLVTTRTDYYYHYNDIIAININPDMSIQWATKIPKRQTTVNDGGYYSSYSYAVKEDKIYLVFNDDPDNLNQTDPRSIADYTSPKKSVSTLVTINSDGKWKKDLLFSNKEEGVILRPKICEQSAADQMFLYAEKGNNYVIGKIML